MKELKNKFDMGFNEINHKIDMKVKKDYQVIISPLLQSMLGFRQTIFPGGVCFRLGTIEPVSSLISISTVWNRRYNREQYCIGSNTRVIISPSLPSTAGRRYQRGHGLGNIFGGLFKAAMPLLKKGAKTLEREALKTGLNIAGDVVQGQSFLLPIPISHTGLCRWNFK
jgi:hypothetical protein